jgi:hemin uptake protein HemP
MGEDRGQAKQSSNSAQSASAARRELKRIDARELLGANGELIIMHSGREYHLRLTSNGKLILTA